MEKKQECQLRIDNITAKTDSILLHWNKKMGLKSCLQKLRVEDQLNALYKTPISNELQRVYRFVSRVSYFV